VNGLARERRKGQSVATVYRKGTKYHWRNVAGNNRLIKESRKRGFDSRLAATDDLHKKFDPETFLLINDFGPDGDPK
jgi:hypothetical protein